ncbi:hypothetical protein HDU91_001330 [Kappamyces sp. JEL0680]|nr:hypothetical protein HDU91_001330 [Kappamyces sp. JEL0680]
MTKEQTRKLQRQGRLRLLTLADVSCDIHGSFEFMGKSSTIDHPYYMYDPETEKTHETLEAAGIQIMSIDNLPTEMPLEASEFFSEALYPVVAQMVKGDFNNPVLARATITKPDGTLESKHAALKNAIAKHAKRASVTATKKILLLGSGFVAQPLVDYLLRNPFYSVTIASNVREEAIALAQGHKHASVVPLDVKNQDQLGALVAAHDVVVSFIPATMHPVVAEACLKHGKNLVTASYISPAMKAFDARAKQAGVVLMNEIGLDPGIDHLTACQMFDEVKEKKGQITSFVSWCGGLPAPEVSNNPLGYKFSWSPKGVLLAGLNSAHFKRDGKEVLIPGSELLANAVDVPIFKGFSFEGLANRDSLSYIDTYKLDPAHLDTMFRGTLRYKGYSELMHCFVRLGFLDSSPRNDLVGLTWAGLLNKTMNGSNLKTHLASKGLLLTPELHSKLVAAMAWLELDSRENPLDPSSTSVLDAFCTLLQNRLVYEEGERDMVVMHHEFGVRLSSGKQEKRASTMVAYGDPASYSAMAKTVGYPAAIATDMLLKGEIKEPGVIAPMAPSIYNPMIAKLHAEGIKFVESVE